MKLNTNQYSFEGLCHPVGKSAPNQGPCSSLCYLLSLTESANHPISNELVAKRILSWLYEVEEQSRNAKHLKCREEEFFRRYFDGGFHPTTPCMITEHWSPISTLLEKEYDPLILNREVKGRAVASGIWAPKMMPQVQEIDSARTDVELFGAIFEEISQPAAERKMLISIIAQPGWSYKSAINSLPNWPSEEISKAGRILWKRTAKG